MKINRNKVDTILAEKKWSMSDLSRHMGVSPQAVLKYFKSNARPITVGRMANALDCGIDDIIE